MLLLWTSYVLQLVLVRQTSGQQSQVSLHRLSAVLADVGALINRERQLLRDIDAHASESTPAVQREVARVLQPQTTNIVQATTPPTQTYLSFTSEHPGWPFDDDMFQFSETKQTDQTSATHSTVTAAPAGRERSDVVSTTDEASNTTTIVSSTTPTTTTTLSWSYSKLNNAINFTAATEPLIRNMLLFMKITFTGYCTVFIYTLFNTTVQKSDRAVEAFTDVLADTLWDMKGSHTMNCLHELLQSRVVVGATSTKTYTGKYVKDYLRRFVLKPMRDMNMNIFARQVLDGYDVWFSATEGAALFHALVNFDDYFTDQRPIQLHRVGELCTDMIVALLAPANRRRNTDALRDINDYINQFYQQYYPNTNPSGIDAEVDLLFQADQQLGAVAADERRTYTGADDVLLS